MLTRQTDHKGRVTLGERFANRTVIVREVDATEVVVTLARILPEREAWLYENASAKAAVFEGLRQAKAGQVAADPPDLEQDEKVVRQLEGNA